MAKTSFYNDNANRSYPFLRGEAFVSHAAIVDCGFILGSGTGFIEGTHNVFLSKVERQGSIFIFEFTSDAPGLLDSSLLFVRDASETEYVTEHVDESDNQGLSLSASTSASGSITFECGNADAWLGYLVTGPLTELGEDIPSGAVTGSAQVEPALLRSVVDTYVRTINLANGDRTRYESPDGCYDQCWPHDIQPMYVRGTCLVSPIRFRPGYNISIRQSIPDNEIVFDAQVGANAGEPCAQIPLFEGEVPPDDSAYLEGGPGCADVIRSINGVGGRILPVRGGLGVGVSEDPANSKIIVDINTLDMAVCIDPEESLSEPCPDEDSVSDICDPCDWVINTPTSILT